MTDTDLVAGAVLELYGSPADTFVAVRTAWVKRARAAKDKEAAATIAGLRKPTRSAEILNLLARGEPSAIDDLLGLGAELRRAQRAADATQLRELTARRRALVADLLRLAAAVDGDLTPGVRDEITATLGAALVDDAVAAGLRSGTLSRSDSWDGFGPEVSVQLSVVRDREPTDGSRTPDRDDAGDHVPSPAAREARRPDLRLVPPVERADDEQTPDTPGESDTPAESGPDQDEPGAAASPPAGRTAVGPSVPDDDAPGSDDPANQPDDDAHDQKPHDAESDDVEPDNDEPELSDRQLKDQARALSRVQVREEEHARRAAAQAELAALEDRRAAQRAERAEQARGEARRRFEQASAAHRSATTGLEDLDADIARLTRQLDNLRQDRDDQAELVARAQKAAARAEAELRRLDD